MTRTARCGLGALLAMTAAWAIPANPTPGELVALEVWPEQILIERADAYVQVLLTGVREDGGRVDVTRQARRVAECSLVEVSDRGLVRPLCDGQGELAFEVDGMRVAIPVSVRGVGQPPQVSFVQDVQPILARTGCSTGTCHGSANGKNGFKLSLRGYDPEFDYRALTDDLAGRRFNRAAPDQSLFLLKPTAAVPHEGGQRLSPDGSDYRVLRAWVAAGAEFDPNAPAVVRIELHPQELIVPTPGASQQFAVLAHHADGGVRDVTAHAFVETSDIEVATADEHGLVKTLRRGDSAILARYQGRYAATRLFVMGERQDFVWQDVPEFDEIDTLVYANLRRVKALPSELCTDDEFLRRAYLDLTGLPPTRRQVTGFLIDGRDSRVKRDELIDRLIGSAEFIEHWTNRWADLLRVNRLFLGVEGAASLRDWLRRSVASNVPYDRFVHELLTASGSTLKNPPAAYYKVLREPDVLMEHTTQVFLGIRFNCNKCHDHPFERWTQRQHWQLAAYFSQVQREDAPGSKKMPKSSVMGAGEQPPAYEEIVSEPSDAPGDVQDPDGRSYGPSLPYLHPGEVDPATPRRQQLADWLTSPENPYFASSYVNRVWSYFFGRGLIEPVDDIRAGNPPSNPELLQRLTEDFVASGFDVRALMRRICRSRTYQHSARTNRWNEDDQVHFSHALPRRLPAETLYDAVHLATGARTRLPGVRPGTRASELLDPEVKTADGFLDLFGRPARDSACECARQTGTSLGQALNLVNGPTLAAAIADPDNEIAQLVAYERDVSKVVAELYLSFLSRLPTAEETAALLPLFETGDVQNTSTLTPADLNELQCRRATWEAERRVPTWHPLEVGNIKSAGGAELALLDDGSILVRGESPDTDTYTVVAWTDRMGITGFRLEALPDKSLPAQGPGRAENGNFALTGFSVTAVPAAESAAAAEVVLTKATADFSQDGWPVAQSIVESAKGWAVMPRVGKLHEAYYETAEDLGSEAGTVLVFTMKQPFGGEHTLGRFRLSVTQDPRPIRHHGLSADLAAALRLPADQRSAEQEAALFRHYIRSDREMADKIRLGAAQDLAWALVNSSAFLFNR